MKNQIGIIYKQLTNKLKNLAIKIMVRKLLYKFKLYPVAKRILLTIFRYTLPISSEKLAFFSQFVKEGDLCYDIGAWAGEFVELFLRLKARVIAVEPQKEYVKKLEILYGKNTRVKIIGKAVGKQVGHGEIIICQNHPTISTLSPQWINESRYVRKFKESKIKKQPVSIITLETLIKSFGVPKFCKIDVEGFEVPVLKGLNQPIPFISYEFTKELLYNVENISKHLSTIGNVRFNCVLFGSKIKFLFQNWVTAEELYNKLDSYENDLLCGDIYVKFIESNDF